MRPVCPVMSAVPSGPPTRAPARTPSRPPPRVVPGIVPAVEAEAPAPAAERERRAPCSPVGTCPAVIPRVYINRSAPCPEHRSDVLGFHPDLVTGNDDVVECRVVGRSIGETAAIAEIIVTRRHPVCRRLEAPQAPCIGAFVRIGYDILVGVRTVFVILVLRSGGLRLRDTRLPFGPAGLGGGLFGFGLRLLFPGDGGLIVQRVQIVVGVSRRCVIGRRTAGQPRRQDKGSD